MATSPAPDAAAPPGMCPGIAVLGGGSAGGDGDGDGSGGKDGAGGDGSGNGNGADGDGKGAQGAPDYTKFPECGYASHPVDVVTGRAFTHPITDLELPGPLPLVFSRMYSSKMADRDMGLGYGWGHTFGWAIEVERRRIRVWNEQGVAVDFPVFNSGGEVIGPWGWLLRRDDGGFSLDVDDGVWRLFAPADEQGKRYRLAAVEDNDRNRIALNYDEDRLVEVVDSGGRVIRIPSTKEGRIASIEVKNAVAQGQWVAFASYTYDNRGNLVGATDADGFSAHYEYDDDHRLTADADRVGLTFHFVYDREGRCVESWGDYAGKKDPSLAGGLPTRLSDGVTRAKGIHHCKLDYGPGGYSEVTDSTETRRYFGNKHGTLDRRVEGGGVISATYDANGHLLTREDPMGGVVSYTRDARGRLISLTDALGRVTTIERDSSGRMTRFTTPSGGVRTVVRNRFGNAIASTDEYGATTTYSYDERGLLVARTGPDGGTTRHEHDAHGNVTVVTMPNGGSYRYTYDVFGRALSETDPLGAINRYTYSVRGDIITKYDTTGDCTQFRYDGEHHLTSITSPTGRATEIIWGGYHKLCGIRDANGHWTRIGYTADGAPLEIVNERGERHTYGYRPTGLMVEEQTFDHVRTQYKYDLADELVETRDALGRRTVFVRNLTGELIERHLPDDTIEVYEHDLLGNVVRATAGAVEVRFDRDIGGQVRRETLAIGDEVHTIDHSWDVAGRSSARHTSLGHTEERRFDRDTGTEYVVLSGQVEVRRQVDLLGRERIRHLPRGGRIESEFDVRGNLVRRGVFAPLARQRLRADEPQWVGNRSDGRTFEQLFNYNEDGELVGVLDDRGAWRRFEYDPIGQLLAAVPDRARGEIFRFDATGNLHEEGQKGPIPTEYGPGNRLLRRGDALYRWNELGQLEEKSVRAEDGREQMWRYAWTGAGQLKSVSLPDGSLVDFEYDAFDRRVGKRVSRPASGLARPVLTTVTRFVWDGNVLVHEIKRTAVEAGDPVVEERTYCFEEDSTVPMAHLQQERRPGAAISGDWVHYVNDPSGAPDRLVGADGSVLCEIRRAAWGRVEIGPGAQATTPIRFQGQFEDDETGLFYNRFRYYDPEAGRYISADPIGVSGGLNLFQYVADPTGSSDPFGLVRCTCTIKLKNPIGGETNYEANSGDSKTTHHKEVKDALLRVDDQKPGGKKPPSHAKGNCAEPRVLSDYLTAWEKENGTIKNHKDRLKALNNIESIDPYDNTLKKRKKMCAWCLAMMQRLGGNAAGMIDKVKKKSAVK